MHVCDIPNETLLRTVKEMPSQIVGFVAVTAVPEKAYYIHL
jgi:hypothetical protein